MSLQLLHMQMRPIHLLPLQEDVPANEIMTALKADHVMVLQMQKTAA